MKAVALSGVLICLLFGGSSCDVLNKEEETPVFLEIDTITVSTNYQIQGSAAANISDAWVYIDDQPVGVFELPCKVPILSEGKRKVSVGAGIRINGISATRSPYPFYRFFNTEVNLEKGKNLLLQPQVTYFDSIVFAYREDFEIQAGYTFQASPVSDTTLQIENNPSAVFEGNASLKAEIFRNTTARLIFESTTVLNIPSSSQQIYLELNYKNNYPLIVGISSLIPQASPVITQVAGMNPSENWNKIYIDLTRAIKTQNAASGHKLVFFADKTNPNLPLRIMIDNVKVVY